MLSEVKRKMNIGGFVGYVCLSAFTPGPNNIMSVSNSARVGLKRAMRFCLGCGFGALITMSLCALFTSALKALVPTIMPFMRWIGAAYMLLLAYIIFRDKPHKDKKKFNLNPENFTTGIITQFVNIKVILYGITSLSTFILPYATQTYQIVLSVLFLATACFAGTAGWAVFGSLFQRLFEKYRKPMNIIMSLLLVYCAVTAVWTVK